MLTHYFALAGALAIGVYVLLRLRGRKLLLAIAAMIAAAVIYAMIWLPFMLPQRASALEANFWISEPTSAAHVLNTLQRAITSPARMVADFDMNNPLTLLFGAMLIVPLFIVRKKQEILMWYVWLVFGIGFIAMLDLGARNETTEPGSICFTRRAGLLHFICSDGSAAFELAPIHRADYCRPGGAGVHLIDLQIRAGRLDQTGQDNR